MSERDRVRAYLSNVLRENRADGGEFRDNESLVVTGRLSSLDVVNVLTFLEREFDFSLDPNEFDIARFDTVDGIVAMLESHHVA